MQILKFGGTSVADPQALARSIAIINTQSQQNKGAQLVIVSAAAGVTNALLAIADATTEATIAANREFIYQRQLAFLAELPKDTDYSNWLIEALAPLLQELDAALPCRGADRDRLISLGERFSARVVSAYLRHAGRNANHMPATSMLVTDHTFGHAEPDTAATKTSTAAALAGMTLTDNELVLVSEGFIGATPEGEITTLGRGGSDYSAALLAEALNAELVQIWTDVKGLYSTDPRIVPEAQPLAELSFAQAAELATFGAKVLHPKTLWPAMRADIPVFIGSTLDPSGGTTIRRQVESTEAYTALALRRNQTLLKITSPDMLYSYGFLAKTFAILAEHRISVDLVTTSEISVALTLDQRGSEQALSDQVLKALAALGKVEIKQNLALVAVVGASLNTQPQVAATIFGALGDMNVRLICHGASPHNLCVLVDDEQGENAIKRLHQQLFRHLHA